MSDPALDAAGSSLPLSSPRTAAAPRAHSEARADSAGKEHVIDAMRGFAALLVAYFHCRQVAWVGMQAFHQSVGHSFSLNAHGRLSDVPDCVGLGRRADFLRD